MSAIPRSTRAGRNDVVKLSSDFLTISLYPGGPYKQDIVGTAFDDLVSTGAQPMQASVWKVAPSAADPDSLYMQDYESLDVDLRDSGNRSEVDRHVLDRCVMHFHGLPISCEIQLRCSFRDYKTFAVEVDFPYSALFQESGLARHGVLFASFVIEAIALTLFESGFYLYGGIGWEFWSPSLKDLRTRTKTLPDDEALYSALLVDALGRSRVMELLKGVRRKHQFHHAGIYFAWSYWHEEHGPSQVPPEFRNFISQFDPALLP